MENSPTPAPASGTPSTPQRKVELQHATISADESRVQRSAAFTDGSTRAVEMQWDQVRRVAAFRRDVMTQPVLCVAITDPGNIVVLDESMDGWDGLLKELARRLSESASFAQWRESIQPESPDSYWTALFKAQ